MDTETMKHKFEVGPENKNFEYKIKLISQIISESKIETQIEIKTEN